MKKIGLLFKSLLFTLCFVFTASTLLCWAGASVLANAAGSTDWSFKSETFGAILTFSVAVSIVSLILKARFIRLLILRLCLHFVLLCGCFTLFLFLLGLTNGSGTFLLVAAFALAYIVVASVIEGIRASRIKKAKAKQAYQSQFGE